MHPVSGTTKAHRSTLDGHNVHGLNHIVDHSQSDARWGELSAQDTIYRVMKHYSKMKQPVPHIFVQLYSYQAAHASSAAGD